LVASADKFGMRYNVTSAKLGTLEIIIVPSSVFFLFFTLLLHVFFAEVTVLTTASMEELSGSITDAKVLCGLVTPVASLTI
jgi:hypothetical protein